MSKKIERSPFENNTPPPILPEDVKEYTDELSKAQKRKEKIIEILSKLIKIEKKPANPKEEIHGGIHFQVQHNWFAAVVSCFDAATHYNLPTELNEDIKDFNKYCTNREFKKNKTRDNDIERADQLVDRVLEELGYEKLEDQSGPEEKSGDLYTGPDWFVQNMKNVY